MLFFTAFISCTIPSILTLSVLACAANSCKSFLSPVTTPSFIRRSVSSLLWSATVCSSVFTNDDEGTSGGSEDTEEDEDRDEDRDDAEAQR